MDWGHGAERRLAKSQIPNPKHQKNPKPQIPKAQVASGDSGSGPVIVVAPKLNPRTAGFRSDSGRGRLEMNAGFH